MAVTAQGFPQSLGFLIWDSRGGLNCNPNVAQPIQFTSNFRPAVLVPKTIGTQTTVWELYDGKETSNTAWGSYATGQRNGIAVTTPDGVIQLWDVKGFTSSDASTTDSPLAKMEAFANLPCEDCDENANILTGQYSSLGGTAYPALSTTTSFCYTFARADDGTSQAASLVEMYYANYIIGPATFISRSIGAGITVWRICLNRPIAQIGYPSTDTSWTLTT